MPINIFKSAKTVHSQHGEDGILEELLKILEIEKGFFVEFGAWDGKHWSNTYYCYERGWTGCYIEGMESRYAELEKNVPDEKVIKVKSYIDAEGPNSLDEILTRHNVEKVDLLSIDIDSDDLLIWESIKKYRAPVVIIEYVSTIPFDTRYINPKGEGHGNSALSILESANKRGYTLVEGTDTNLIFVLDELISKTDVICKSLQEIRDQTYQYRMFVGIDGTVVHDFKLFNDNGITEIFPLPFVMSFGIQPIPKFMRKVRMRTNYYALALFLFFAIFRCPLELLKLVKLGVRTLSPKKGIFGLFLMIFDKDQMMKILKKN